MKMPVWKYNNKCYLKMNDKKHTNMLSINLMNHKIVKLNKLNLTKQNLTSWITFYRHEFEKERND